jgi:hypothetical protein
MTEYVPLHIREHRYQPDDHRLSCSVCGLPAANRHHHAGRPDGSQT